MQFPCPNCHSTLSLPADSAGRKAQCPSCQSVFRVPDAVSGELPPAAMPDLSVVLMAVVKPERPDRVGCPGCDKILAYDANSAGRIVICPNCQRRIQMPTVAASPLIQVDPGPYASPPATPIWDRPTTIANYEAPGWCLFGVSIAALIVDVLWIGMICLGLLEDNLDDDTMIGFAIFFLWAFLSIICHLVTLVAGLRMTQRRSLSTARLGSIVGLIPCGSCSLLHIPFAIWAVVVLYGSQAAQDFSE